MFTVVKLDSTHPSFNQHFSSEQQVLILNENKEAVAQLFGPDSYSLGWKLVSLLSGVLIYRR